METVIAAVVLIILHTVDGRQIGINPDQVVSLRPSLTATGEAKNKHFTDEVQCVINMTDGKYVTVIESCDAIKKKLEGLR